MYKNIDILNTPTFYINIKSQNKRKKRIEGYLKELGYKNFERFPGVEKEKRLGCSLSHYLILSEIVKNNIYPCLVLEDDAIPLYSKKNIELPLNSDAYYLGITNSGADFYSKNNKISHKIKIKNFSQNFHQVVNMTGRHAILHLSPEYDIEAMERNKIYIKNPKKYCSGDVSISELNKKRNVFAENFPSFYQDSALEESFTKLNIYDCNYEIIKE